MANLLMKTMNADLSQLTAEVNLPRRTACKILYGPLPITICRAPAVYGERDTEIFIFFNTFNKGLMTTIGFDKKVLSLIHVADLVEGFYLAAINEKSAGKVILSVLKNIIPGKK
jgi:nucleoside-diphosphate-sugar epimerase